MLRKTVAALTVAVSICAFGGGQTQVNVPGLSTGVAEAKATLSAADREMKRYKNHERTDIYNRAHRIIYPSGRVPKDQRTRIAVVINGDEQIVVEDRVKNRIYSQLRDKFPIEEFALMKGTDVKTQLLQMAEERYADNSPDVTISETEVPYRSSHGFNILSGVGRTIGAIIGGSGVRNENVRHRSMTTKTDVDHMPIGIQPRGISDLRREDYVRVGRDCGYDYLFVLTMNVGMVKHEAHGWVIYDSITNKGNVWMRVRLIDVNSGDYAYRNDLVVPGESHNSGTNGRLIEKAVDQAMTEAMNDIEIEKE